MCKMTVEYVAGGYMSRVTVAKGKDMSPARGSGTIFPNSLEYGFGVVFLHFKRSKRRPFFFFVKKSCFFKERRGEAKVVILIRELSRLCWGLFQSGHQFETCGFHTLAGIVLSVSGSCNLRCLMPLPAATTHALQWVTDQ